MRIAWLLSFSVATVGCPTAKPSPDPQKPPTAAVTVAPVSPVSPVSPVASVARPPADLDATNAFSLAFYAKLRNGRGNLFVSGPSLRAAAGIAFLGARGETAKEMAAVFGFDSDPAKSASAAKAQRQSWVAARGGAELLEANRLWVERGMTLLPTFITLAATAYEGAVAPTDFTSDAERARQTINAWVGEQTKTRIPELLPDGMVTTLTRVVITNALTFKANWAHPFRTEETVDEPFRSDDKTSQPVPMMHQTAELRLGNVAAASVLELPYAGTDLAMVIVLPDDRNGLAKMEATLSTQALASFTASLIPQRVAVALPRFSFRAGGPVKAPLRELGMRRAFESSADFTNMTDPARPADRLIVDEILHQTFVNVDEVGTEAAAATAVVMAPSGPAPKAKVFRADRPFFFFIRDTKKGGVLFLGRVVQPKA